MSQLVADTHAVIWFLFSNPQLSPAAAATLSGAATAGTTVYVPSISLVEITYLLERNRIPADASKRVRDMLDDRLSLFEIAPLDRAVADALPTVPRSVVPDMPDRIIAATAIARGLPLITADARIRQLPITTIW